MPSSPLQTRGPLPARVYWARRLVLLGLALVVIAGLARVLGSFSNGSDPSGDTATTVGATTSVPTKSSPTEKVRRKRQNRRSPTEPPLAEPSGPCLSSDIVVTPVITTAEGGKDVPIGLNLRTVQTPACTWTVSSDTITVSITSGEDFIWGSRQCPTSVPTQDVVVRAAADTPIVVTWVDARRSDDDCSAVANWALPGFYHVEAATLGGEPTDVQFELVQPASVVITKTVTPKPEPTKSEPTKDGNQGDTEHTPGEQGTGNSEG